MPAGNDKGIPLINLHQGFDDDEDVNGCPADDKSSHHHEHHAGDATHVPVLLLGTRQKPNTAQAKDHQPVADCDDEDWHHKGEDEDADLCDGVPVPIRIRKLQSADCFSCWEKFLSNSAALEQHLC